MSTIALTRPVPPHRAASMSSLASPLSLNVETGTGHYPQHPIPNKHVPICPPGPPADPPSGPPTPIDSSADTDSASSLDFDCSLPQSPQSLPSASHSPPSPPSPQSLLFPPTAYPRSEVGRLAIYSIDAAGVAAALDYIARQPLPSPALVFPWFHGLHPNNLLQQTFFSQRRHVVRQTPRCLRGLTLVKADSRLERARLKGAIAPEEFLQSGQTAEFVEADPQEGFSVRNFQIQAAKTAMTSDIVVYGESAADAVAVEKLAWDISAAQRRWRERRAQEGDILPEYNTFVCTSVFADFEEQHPEIVCIDARGRWTGQVVDLLHQERREMYALTKASEISHNVWLGPTPEPQSAEEAQFDLLVECCDGGRLHPEALRALAASAPAPPAAQPVHLDFPSSGIIPPPTWSQNDADAILDTCKWIYHLAHGTVPEEPDADGEYDLDGLQDGLADPILDALPTPSPSPSLAPSGFPSTLSSTTSLHRRPLKILIHCPDGYTESTMLGIAYFSYSTGQAVPDAWLQLHTDKQRNFFAYPSDVALLAALAPRLLHESPAHTGGKPKKRDIFSRMDLATVTCRLPAEPRWFGGIDGSFPSRVLDYMYLGNLTHANNPELLRALGITQILSVGEVAMWREGELETWGEDNICAIQGVQDNGIDPLTDVFMQCLEFIATLVHCRVGVSRSATICIAEVMRSLHLSFPRAYCFVRARRLNVIIQPHLLFAYELLKWEELLKQQDEGHADTVAGFKRELEWGDVAREVALMNQPYVR